MFFLQIIPIKIGRKNLHSTKKSSAFARPSLSVPSRDARSFIFWPKIPILVYFCMLMETLGTFYGHCGTFKSIWCILPPFGNLVYIFPLWYIRTSKIWHPWSRATLKSTVAVKAWSDRKGKSRLQEISDMKFAAGRIVLADINLRKFDRSLWSAIRMARSGDCFLWAFLKITGVQIFRLLFSRRRKLCM
jgi:hypothetical protein